MTVPTSQSGKRAKSALEDHLREVDSLLLQRQDEVLKALQEKHHLAKVALARLESRQRFGQLVILLGFGTLTVVVSHPVMRVDVFGYFIGCTTILVGCLQWDWVRRRFPSALANVSATDLRSIVERSSGVANGFQ